MVEIAYEQWLLDEENDDHDLYNGLINNSDCESSSNIDSTEVVSWMLM